MLGSTKFGCHLKENGRTLQGFSSGAVTQGTLCLGGVFGPVRCIVAGQVSLPERPPGGLASPKLPRLVWKSLTSGQKVLLWPFPSAMFSLPALPFLDSHLLVHSVLLVLL